MKKNKIILTIVVAIAVFIVLVIILPMLYLTNKKTEQIVIDTENNTEETTAIVNKKNEPAEPTDELYSALSELCSAANKYFEENKTTQTFLSIYSMLYIDNGVEKSEEINALKLKKEGYYTNSFDLTDSIILYVKPTDFSKYNNAIQTENNSFEIFVAFETSDGFTVVSEKYGSFTVPSEDFRNIMLKYNLIHGEVKNPKAGSSEYNAIINAVKEHTKQPIDYIVRYMACDDLYGMIVFSDSKNTADIKQYSLIYENNNWRVDLSELQNEKNVKQAVNKAHPDFELSMVPFYNLSEYNGKIKSDFSTIIEMLKESNIVEKDDAVTYSCGTDKVLYLEFSSGKKLVGGVNKNNELNCDYVNNYKEAVVCLTKYVEIPPVFILKYQY